MTIHCDICEINYADGDIMGKPNLGLACQCRPNICVACTTLLCMNDIKPVAGSATAGIVLEQDPEKKTRCPFCRKDIDPFVKELFTRGPLYEMFLAIKICKFLGMQDNVRSIQNNYREQFGHDCPI